MSAGALRPRAGRALGPRRLAFATHKVIWRDGGSESGYATDGGFPRQLEALSDLFEETTLLAPARSEGAPGGLTPLRGRGLRVVPLSVPGGSGWRRKLGMGVWTARHWGTFARELGRAEAVHAGIPGDVGTIGLLGAWFGDRPLFARHCGTWGRPRTLAERGWIRLLETIAGGRTVAMATGGAGVGGGGPSDRNSSIGWIFATSLTEGELEGFAREFEEGEAGRRRGRRPSRLAIACRQDAAKGTGVVLEAMAALVSEGGHEDLTLDVAGDGPDLEGFRRLASDRGLGDRVRFHGRLPRRGVLEMLGEADLFCYPTGASEGFPKVVHEAMARGVPVLGTGVSAIPELLRGGGGTLLEDRRPETLARAIAGWRSDPEGYARARRSALETARRYSLEGWRDAIAERLGEAWGWRGDS